MLKGLNLTTSISAVCFLVGCAEQTNRVGQTAAGVRSNPFPSVRTTAYKCNECGGRRNALGTSLSCRRVMSAASDWSRFPLGTRFRIVETKEEYIIDDYGPALVGTSTIDL